MNFLAKDAAIEKHQGNLPHWRQGFVCYFVTFRTADSVPQIKLNQWLLDREKWLEKYPEPRSDEQIDEYHKLFSNKMERWLDSGYGDCLLADPTIKSMLTQSLTYFSNQRYHIWEYAVAANHVHLLIEPINNNELSDIMRSIKSYTANEINKHSGRKGQFWQKEYFDHILRSEEQYMHIVQYIRNHNKRGLS